MITFSCECGATYRVAEQYAGKSTRCKRCQTKVRIPEHVPPEEEDEFYSLEDLLTGEATSPPSSPSTSPAVATHPIIGAPSPAEVQPIPTAANEQTASPLSAFWSDIPGSLAFPFRSLGNFVTVGILIFLLILADVTRFAFIIGMFAGPIIYGWFYAFQFETCSNAASGDNDLPTFSFEDGWVEGIIWPLINWLAASVAAGLFALSFAIWWMVSAGIGFFNWFETYGGLFAGEFAAAFAADPSRSAIFVSLLMLGIFLWPMFMLIVAVGRSPLMLVRLDLILTTVIRTPLGYLSAALLVMVAVWASLLVPALVLGPAEEPPIAALLAAWLIGKVSLVYFQLLAMIVMGLYYHHFKRGFAWSWG